MIPYSQCNGCVFAQSNNSQQTSCKLDRASKLGIQDKDEDGFFILSRFCNTYRPEEWLKDLSFAESEDINATVMNEVYPKVGFFVLLDTSKEGAIESLKATLHDIKEQEIISPKYIVVINDKVEYSEEVCGILAQMFNFDETAYHVVQLEIELDNPSKRIDEAFTHAKNGWAYVTSSGESVPRNLIYTIHKRINIDMKKLVVVKPYGEINGLLFQAALFKFVNGNKPKLYQDEVVDSRSFLEKIEHAALESDDETFITWSEFNES